MRRERVRMVGGVVVALYLAVLLTATDNGWWPPAGMAVCHAQDQIDPGVIKPSGCPAVCDLVSQGSLNTWDALFLFGCWCESGGNALSLPPASTSILAAQVKGVIP